jgi:hypothetical protein
METSESHRILEGSLISRSHVIGLGLAVGLMLAAGTGLAAADTPSPAPPTQDPAVCKVVSKAGTAIIVTAAPGSGKCLPADIVRGAIPKGAPGTGGGGMAAEVGSWH